MYISLSLYIYIYQRERERERERPRESVVKHNTCQHHFPCGTSSESRGKPANLDTRAITISCPAKLMPHDSG